MIGTAAHVDKKRLLKAATDGTHTGQFRWKPRNGASSLFRDWHHITWEATLSHRLNLWSCRILLSGPTDNTGTRPGPVQHAATILAAAGNADTRCQAPEAFPPPSSGSKNVMLFQVLLHSTIHYHAHQSAACQRQLHAVDMRHARTDARTATVTPHALSGLGCAGPCPSRPLRHCSEDEMW